MNTQVSRPQEALPFQNMAIVNRAGITGRGVNNAAAQSANALETLKWRLVNNGAGAADLEFVFGGASAISKLTTLFPPGATPYGTITTSQFTAAQVSLDIDNAPLAISGIRFTALTSEAQFDNALSYYKIETNGKVVDKIFELDDVSPDSFNPRIIAYDFRSTGMLVLNWQHCCKILVNAGEVLSMKMFVGVAGNRVSSF